MVLLFRPGVQMGDDCFVNKCSQKKKDILDDSGSDVELIEFGVEHSTNENVVVHAATDVTRMKRNYLPRSSNSSMRNDKEKETNGSSSRYTSVDKNPCNIHEKLMGSSFTKKKKFCSKVRTTPLLPSSTKNTKILIKTKQIKKQHCRGVRVESQKKKLTSMSSLSKYSGAKKSTQLNGVSKIPSNYTPEFVAQYKKDEITSSLPVVPTTLRKSTLLHHSSPPKLVSLDQSGSNLMSSSVPSRQLRGDGLGLHEEDDDSHAEIADAALGLLKHAIRIIEFYENEIEFKESKTEDNKTRIIIGFFQQPWKQFYKTCRNVSLCNLPSHSQTRIVYLLKAAAIVLLNDSTTINIMGIIDGLDGRDIIRIKKEDNIILEIENLMERLNQLWMTILQDIPMINNLNSNYAVTDLFSSLNVSTSFSHLEPLLPSSTVDSTETRVPTWGVLDIGHINQTSSVLSDEKIVNDKEIKNGIYTHRCNTDDITDYLHDSTFPLPYTVTLSEVEEQFLTFDHLIKKQSSLKLYLDEHIIISLFPKLSSHSHVTQLASLFPLESRSTEKIQTCRHIYIVLPEGFPAIQFNIGYHGEITMCHFQQFLRSIHDQLTDNHPKHSLHTTQSVLSEWKMIGKPLTIRHSQIISLRQINEIHNLIKHPTNIMIRLRFNLLGHAKKHNLRQLESIFTKDLSSVIRYSAPLQTKKNKYDEFLVRVASSLSMIQQRYKQTMEKINKSHNKLQIESSNLFLKLFDDLNHLARFSNILFHWFLKVCAFREILWCPVEPFSPIMLGDLIGYSWDSMDEGVAPFRLTLKTFYKKLRECPNEVLSVPIYQRKKLSSFLKTIVIRCGEKIKCYPFITQRNKPVWIFDNIVVKRIAFNDPRERLRGQLGVFTTRTIRKYEIIGPYVGFVYSDSLESRIPSILTRTFVASREQLSYEMTIKGNLAIDSSRAGNRLNFVNDYRLVPEANFLNNSERKNCEIKSIFTMDGDEEGPEIPAYCATRDIQPGEEILADYGEAYWAPTNPATTKPYISGAKDTYTFLGIANKTWNDLNELMTTSSIIQST